MIGYLFAGDIYPPFTELDVRLICLTPGCENEYVPPPGWVANYPHDLSTMIREAAGARAGWTVDEYGIDRCPEHATGKDPYSAYPVGHPLACEDATLTRPDAIPVAEVLSRPEAVQRA